MKKYIITVMWIILGFAIGHFIQKRPLVINLTRFPCPTDAENFSRETTACLDLTINTPND